VATGVGVVWGRRGPIGGHHGHRRVVELFGVRHRIARFRALCQHPWNRDSRIQEQSSHGPTRRDARCAGEGLADFRRHVSGVPRFGLSRARYRGGPDRSAVRGGRARQVPHVRVGQGAAVRVGVLRRSDHRPAHLVFHRVRAAGQGWPGRFAAGGGGRGRGAGGLRAEPAVESAPGRGRLPRMAAGPAGRRAIWDTEQSRPDNAAHGRGGRRARGGCRRRVLLAAARARPDRPVLPSRRGSLCGGHDPDRDGGGDVRGRAGAGGRHQTGRRFGAGCGRVRGTDRRRPRADHPAGVAVGPGPARPGPAERPDRDHSRAAAGTEFPWGDRDRGTSGDRGESAARVLQRDLGPGLPGTTRISRR
jgi:hypothetical protein